MINAHAMVVLDASDKVNYTRLVPRITQVLNYDAAMAALASLLELCN